MKWIIAFLLFSTSKTSISQYLISCETQQWYNNGMVRFRWELGCKDNNFGAQIELNGVQRLCCGCIAHWSTVRTIGWKKKEETVLIYYIIIEAHSSAVQQPHMHVYSAMSGHRIPFGSFHQISGEEMMEPKHKKSNPSKLNFVKFDFVC